MVGKFREFLNTSPIFDEERRSLPSAWGQRRPGRRVPQPVPTGGSPAGGPTDGGDDDAYDNEDDYEGMDTVMPQPDNPFALQFGPYPLNGMADSSAFNPMTHGLVGQAMAALSPEGATTAPDGTHPSTMLLDQYAFSNFIHGTSGSGSASMNAYGPARASIASLGHQATGQMSNGESPAAGASAAPLHQRPESGGSG